MANVDNLSKLLDRICSIADCGAPAEDDDTPVTIGAILDTVGRRAYGPLLLVVGVFSISPATVVPGMTWASALIVLVIAGQMALGLKTPWLPHKVLEMTTSRGLLIKGVNAARPWAARIDRFLKPRWTFLTTPPFVNLVALACVAAALITFPLGLIPFAPLAPGIAITLIGLGVAARDGVMISLAGGALGLAIWLVLKVVT